MKSSLSGSPARERSSLPARAATALAALGLLLSVGSGMAESGQRIWQPAREESLDRARRTAEGHWIASANYRTLWLDRGALHELLTRAPLETAGAARGNPVVLDLPLPEGGFGRFRIEESPIMAPELAAQFPEIRTYRGLGLDDPTASARLDTTPAGFHAMILSASGTIYVDPYARGDVDRYITYYKRDYRRAGAEAWRCLTGSDPLHRMLRTDRPAAPPASFGTTKRTYRLALAATGEYTAFQGGTVNAAMSAMTTTMNRVNGIYERELSVHMDLVGNNSSVVYTDANTDPYTNNDGATMLCENARNLDTVIGQANYDIGHVFSTGGGGIAGLGVVCRNTSFGCGTGSDKAQGVTGSLSPSGDAFDVDYVAHEMGHQFGANHTFNADGTTAGSCNGNRNPGTAYEPGSGSTIMAYAGICGVNSDLQPNSNDYFHFASLDEISTYLVGGGNACASSTATGNNSPTVSAGSNYTIPRQTPFMLTATGSDVDGDSLTYCWEEADLGNPSPPNTDDGSRPILRSFSPVASSSRVFPKLADILSNSSSFGETLPSTSRTMNFRVTARDNRSGAGAINDASMQLTVTDTAGPFAVTAPNTATTLAGGSSQTVTWNVAGTSSAPVSCASVAISLSTDGGNTFGTTLTSSTPNDGSESVQVSNVSTTQGRIKVACAGNVFFDISDADLTITVSGNVPVVTSVTAGSGPAGGGTDVVIRGTGFLSGATASFGGAAATNVRVHSSTYITATTPAGTPGPATVVVTNPGGLSGSKAGGFQYLVVINSFTVGPTIVAAGGTSTLSWFTTGATSVAISGVSGTLATSGSTSVSYTQTTTYTLTATGPDSSTVTATATVVVLPAPGVSLGFPNVTAPPASATIVVSGVTFAWDAVASAAGYGIGIWDGRNGRTVFSGSLAGNGATSTLISLPDGLYLFGVRACTAAGFTDADCGSYATRDFTIDLLKPTGTPAVSAPADGASLTSSTQTLSWSAVVPDSTLLSMTYEVLLDDLATGTTALQINVPDPSTSTIFSLKSSALYRLKVRACQAACGPFSTPAYFSVTLGAVPSGTPTVNTPTITGGNQLGISWSTVAGADLYQIQVVQPTGGPGGGALTVAARQVSSTSVSLPVPAGQANIVVAACNGDGCGPFSSAVSINPAGPNPSTPNPGTPMAGTVVAGPTVLFTWNRIPGDTGTNTSYRVYVQDLSRQAAALDVRTKDNFYAAYFKAEGARYDVQVVANPGCTGAGGTCSGAETPGPSVGFNVAGSSSDAPTMVSPAHNSTLAQGNIQLGWSPVAGATLYEYFVAVQGISAPTVRGVTPGLLVQVPLTTGTGNTIYSGIVRACPAGATCVAGSDAGWGPWSVDAGPGVTNFTVTP